MDVFVAFLVAVLALAVGAAVGFVFAQSRAKGQPNPLQPFLDQSAARVAELSAQVQEQATTITRQGETVMTAAAGAAAAEAARDALREQVGQLIDQQKQHQSAQQQATQQENKVLQALSPVQENLRTMQAKIAELEQQRASQYGSLAEQLKQSQQADSELRAATSDLVGALKSNSVRGAWGEAQLRNIVESAGLIEHVDFETQTSVTGDNGRQRPDMILKVPGGKVIPIDAKVPFSSYIQATDAGLIGAPDEASRRKSLMTDHVKAVRSHVDTLASKAYWQAFDGSPDFVVAFIPSEALLSSALEADPSLLDYAFNKRVALASPVALWSVLKTVAFAWQQDLLTEDAKRLFDLSQELYERMRVLGDYADKLGGALESSVVKYNAFAASLEGRVLVTARKFARIDETKLIAEPRQIDTVPRALSAPELTTFELTELELTVEALHSVESAPETEAGAETTAKPYLED